MVPVRVGVALSLSCGRKEKRMDNKQSLGFGDEHQEIICPNCGRYLPSEEMLTEEGCEWCDVET